MTTTTTTDTTSFVPSLLHTCPQCNHSSPVPFSASVFSQTVLCDNCSTLTTGAFIRVPNAQEKALYAQTDELADLLSSRFHLTQQSQLWQPRSHSSQSQSQSPIFPYSTSTQQQADTFHPPQWPLRSPLSPSSDVAMDTLSAPSAMQLSADVERDAHDSEMSGRSSEQPHLSKQHQYQTPSYGSVEKTVQPLVFSSMHYVPNTRRPPVQYSGDNSSAEPYVLNGYGAMGHSPGMRQERGNENGSWTGNQWISQETGAAGDRNDVEMS